MPIKLIRKVSFPILIVHGTVDKYIPFTDENKLYNAINGEKNFYAVEGINHSMVLDKGGKELQKKIIDFIRDSLF